MSVGNWSVSQPSSTSPVLASIEPSASGGSGDFQFVLHGVAGERGVVGLEVQLEMLEQIVLAQEIQARGGVGIVLVLGRLLRLGLDVELALEADLLLVVHRHVQERAEVVHLALQVGVQQRACSLRGRPRNV